MKHLQEGVLTKITYTSLSKGEKKDRTVIPSFVPTDNVKAIDVSDLTPELQQQIVQLRNEYNEYVASVMQNLPTFEQYVKTVDQGFNTNDIKWRTFKIDHIE